MDGQPHAAQQAPGEKRRTLAIDEESIAFLGRAARMVPLPEESLTQTPVRDMTAALQALVQRLSHVNVGAVLRKQGLLSRLTGADIEARMVFELEIRQTRKDIDSLRQKATQARRIRQDLRLTAGQIEAFQPRLQRILAAGKRVLDDTTSGDPALRDRFARRLGNLMTLETSNLVTLQQITLADANMSLLIDRIDEVCTTVFALWQRNAMAIAMSAAPVPKTSPLADAMIRAHDSLIKTLTA